MNNGIFLVGEFLAFTSTEFKKSDGTSFVLNEVSVMVLGKDPIIYKVKVKAVDYYSTFKRGDKITLNIFASVYVKDGRGYINFIDLK